MNFVNFIPDDGYTEPGYIAPVPGLNGGLRFHFRPLVVSQQAQWERATGKLENDQWYRKTVDMMVPRILDWDLTDAKGNSVPINQANLLRLKPAVFSRLHGILWGNQASDQDPEWSEGEKQDAVDLAVNVGGDGIPVGVAREAANEKNSAPG